MRGSSSDPLSSRLRSLSPLVFISSSLEDRIAHTEIQDTVVQKYKIGLYRNTRYGGTEIQGTEVQKCKILWYRNTMYGDTEIHDTVEQKYKIRWYRNTRYGGTEIQDTVVQKLRNLWLPEVAGAAGPLNVQLGVRV